MSIENENIVYDYLDQFPDSLTRRAINFDNDELLARIAPLMSQAISDGEPLTDDIFNFDDRADY